MPETLTKLCNLSKTVRASARIVLRGHWRRHAASGSRIKKRWHASPFSVTHYSLCQCHPLAATTLCCCGCLRGLADDRERHGAGRFHCWIVGYGDCVTARLCIHALSKQTHLSSSSSERCGCGISDVVETFVSRPIQGPRQQAQGRDEIEAAWALTEAGWDRVKTEPKTRHVNAWKEIRVE